MREFKLLFNKNMHQRCSTDRQVYGLRYLSKLASGEFNIFRQALEEKVLFSSQENNKVTTDSCQVKESSHLIQLETMLRGVQMLRCF